jgi:hypothetical protein
MKPKKKAKKLPPMKPREAWAVVNKLGNIIACNGAVAMTSKATADEWLFVGETVRRVQVTWEQLAAERQEGNDDSKTNS